MGCGCLALIAIAIAGVIFFIYASTDAGPPVETFGIAMAIIVAARALGVLGGQRAAG